MKKTIFSIILSIGFICTMLFATGCTCKKYEFWGILTEDNLTIQPYEEITDEALKEELSIYEDSYIKLNNDDSYEFTYYMSASPSIMITYTQTGTYTIDEGKLKLKYEKGNDNYGTDLQQYIEGKIIYFNGTHFLVYK